MFQQRTGRDIDADLVIAHPGYHDLAHSRKAVQIVANVVNRALQGLLLGVAKERDHDGRHLGLEFADVDLLGLIGQIAQGVDGALDLVDCFVQVIDIGAELDGDAAAALCECGGEALDLVEIGQGVLDLPGHAFLNFRRACAGIGQRDYGGVGRCIGEEFARERDRGHRAADQDGRHQKIHGYRMGHSEARDAHGTPSAQGSCAVALTRGPPSGTGSTSIPSGSDRAALTTTNVPSGNGSASTAHCSATTPS